MVSGLDCVQREYVWKTFATLGQKCIQYAAVREKNCAISGLRIKLA